MSRKENNMKPIAKAITADSKCHDSMEKLEPDINAVTAKSPMTRYVKTCGIVKVLTSNAAAAKSTARSANVKKLGAL